MPADTLPKLDSCPFCGSDEIFPEPIYGRLWAVMCSECCISTGHWGEKKRAIAAWNKRADQKIRDAKAEVLNYCVAALGDKDFHSDPRCDMETGECCCHIEGLQKSWQRKAAAIMGGE